MEKKGKPDLMFIFAGVTFVIMGVIAYITNLNMVGSIILVVVGIPGIIGGSKGSFGKAQQDITCGTIDTLEKDQQYNTAVEENRHLKE